MNVYIIEDNWDAIQKIKRNVTTALRIVNTEWEGRYGTQTIIDVCTPDFNIGERQSDIHHSRVLSIFKSGPPQIIILDWDLEWKNGINWSGDELVRMIDTHAECNDWNPYIIFTSALSPTALLTILGGKDLTRLFPTSFMLLDKEYLTDGSMALSSFKFVKDAMKQALEYASLNNIGMTVFPLPDTEAYSAILSLNDNGLEQWQTQTAPFTVSYWKEKENEERKFVREIIIKSHNLIAILIGTGETYGVITRHESSSSAEPSVNLYLCTFPTETRRDDLLKRFPFLEGSPGVLFNKKGIKKEGKILVFNPNYLGAENINRLIFLMTEHVQFAEEELAIMEESNHSSHNIKVNDINRLYSAMSKFIVSS